MDTGKGSLATQAPEGKQWYGVAWKRTEIGAVIFPGILAPQRQKRSAGDSWRRLEALVANDCVVTVRAVLFLPLCFYKPAGCVLNL